MKKSFNEHNDQADTEESILLMQDAGISREKAIVCFVYVYLL